MLDGALGLCVIGWPVAGRGGSMRFEGRAGIVTGGSSGIGRAIAHRLADEGADLCLVAAPEDAEQLDAVVAEVAAKGRRAFGIAADVGDPETSEQAVGATLERLGRLDVLASNAGIAYFEDLFDTPIAHLDHTFHVNVRGMFLMTVSAARAMAERGGGAVACTASTASYVGEEQQVTYNVSKGGVAQLVRSLGVDLARYGVRVNGVAPGWVATRATAGILADAAEWSKHRSRIPMDRPADPGEIAAVVAFLLSDDASYLTGSIVVADGGLTAGYRSSDWDAIEQPQAPRWPRRP
jgi:NAD(P)-dependent dehydrogenase (short-subunit alcohol dehydrogenase family)